MDIAALTSLLVSCMPFLIKMGEKAAESASSKVGAFEVQHPLKSATRDASKQKS